MNQNVLIDKHLLYVCVGLLEEGEDVLVFDIVEIDPFMMLYIVFLNLMRHFEVLIGPSIDDGEDAVDAEVIFHGIFKHVDSTQVEASLVFGVILCFVEDIDDMAALPVTPPHLLQVKK